MCVNATPTPSPSSGSSPLRMPGVSLRVFILVFQRDWLLVPEKRELFAEMSVEDNLLLGAFQRHRVIVVQVVDPHDGMAGREKPLRQMKSDETGRAGDEKISHG